MNLVDTSGWVEYFLSGPNAGFFAGPIEKKEGLLVPVVCLYEVFKKVTEKADESLALDAVAQMKEGTVTDVTVKIAISAALISLRHKLAMADSFIYAMARTHKAVIWTQDHDFKDLSGVNYRQAG